MITQKKSFTRTLARKRGAARKLLESASALFSADPSTPNLEAFRAAQLRYSSLTFSRDQDARERMRAHWDASNELPSSYLTSLTRSTHSARYIASLPNPDNPDGPPISGTKLPPYLTSKFADIYKCGKISPSSGRQINWKLLPRLSGLQSSTLSSLFTTDEVEAAIKSLAPDKAPGPDGLPPVST